jgi:hypothetical protein
MAKRPDNVADTNFLQTMTHKAICPSMKLCAKSAKSPRELQLLLVLQEAKSRCDNERD